MVKPGKFDFTQMKILRPRSDLVSRRKIVSSDWGTQNEIARQTQLKTIEIVWPRMSNNVNPNLNERHWKSRLNVCISEMSMTVFCSEPIPQTKHFQIHTKWTLGWQKESLHLLNETKRLHFFSIENLMSDGVVKLVVSNCATFEKLPL